MNETAGCEDLELSIVMPCLNEAETLAACIQQAALFLREHGVAGEVIVADNGSCDGSQEIARQAGARLVDVPTRGYGAALMGGIQAARGRFVVMGDSDRSYDFSSLQPFLDHLRAGADLVMGNRFQGGIMPGAMPFLHRYLGNPILSALGRLFFKAPVGDFHCGLRAFRRQAVLGLDLRTTGMEFASEMVVKAALLGLKISEVPTVLYPDGRTRQPHLRTWRDGWRHLRFLLLYSPTWLFFYPGLALIAAGLAGWIWLLPGPQPIAGVVFDVNTLLYASLLILIGFQSLIFALFTRVFAVSEGLLPPDPALKGLLKRVGLERGLLAGAICILIGTAGLVAALGYWQSTAFGALDPSRSLRLVIPGVTLFALGSQVVLSSFFLSILQLRRK